LLEHREVVFAYPPSHLIRSFVRKAMADGVRGLVLVPMAVTAAYWGRLMEAAIVRSGGTDSDGAVSS
jgi:hypothetical protein